MRVVLGVEALKTPKVHNTLEMPKVRTGGFQNLDQKGQPAGRTAVEP